MVYIAEKRCIVSLSKQTWRKKMSNIILIIQGCLFGYMLTLAFTEITIIGLILAFVNAVLVVVYGAVRKAEKD
jgi:hypothetical protein